MAKINSVYLLQLMLSLLNLLKKPKQVYLSLKKQSDSKNLAVNSYGELNSKTGLYEITFNYENQLVEHINGVYQIEIHVADIRAEKSETWKLGSQ